MIIIKILWIIFLSVFLLLLTAITTIGGLWVLRVAIAWWLEIDYVEKIKERFDKWLNS